MTIRTRKLIGTFVLLTLVTTWALAAMAIAQFVFRSPNSVWTFAYYIVAGMGWIFPAMPLIRWMSGPRRDTPQS